MNENNQLPVLVLRTRKMVIRRQTFELANFTPKFQASAMATREPLLFGETPWAL